MNLKIDKQDIEYLHHSRMESFLLEAKGNKENISERMQFLFRIAKNNTSLTEGERVLTDNRFIRLVEGEAVGVESQMYKDLIAEGLTPKKALEKTKGNAEKAARLLDITSRTVYAFKAKQKTKKWNTITSKEY